MQYLVYIIKFLLYFVTHIFLFSNIALEYAIAFSYVGFLLIIPFRISSILMMIISFFVGLSVDLFYDTLGIHAFACVSTAYIRSYIAKIITVKQDDLSHKDPSLHNMKFNWFFSYAIILLFFHHCLIFFIEGGLSLDFYKQLFKAILSAVLSFIIIYLVERFSYILLKK